MSVNAVDPTTGELTKVAGGGQEIYSTTEVKTNKVWIDGKPIYRKLVAITFPDTEGAYIDIPTGLTNVSFVGLSGYTQKGAFWFPLNWHWFTITTGGVYINSQNGNNVRLQAGTDGNQRGSSGYAILEYTKTTD